MKKLLTITAFALLIGLNANAQKNVIKANIFSPIVRTGSFFYERVITEKMSFQLGFFYTGFKVGETKWRGIGITPEVRFYLSDKETPRGFYLAPYLRYQSLTASMTTTSIDPNTFETTSVQAEANLTTYGGGLLIGHQWLIADRVSLDMFIGPSLNSGTVKAKASDGTDNESFKAGGLTGFGLRTGITLGVAF